MAQKKKKSKKALPPVERISYSCATVIESRGGGFKREILKTLPNVRYQAGVHHTGLTFDKRSFSRE